MNCKPTTVNFSDNQNLKIIRLLKVKQKFLSKQIRNGEKIHRGD